MKREEKVLRGRIEAIVNSRADKEARIDVQGIVDKVVEVVNGRKK